MTRLQVYSAESCNSWLEDSCELQGRREATSTTQAVKERRGRCLVIVFVTFHSQRLAGVLTTPDGTRETQFV